MTIRNGLADNGGGICNNNDATVNINDYSFISDNIANERGGGIFNYGTVNINDYSYVRSNTALIEGDDILNYGILNE